MADRVFEIAQDNVNVKRTNITNVSNVNVAYIVEELRNKLSDTHSDVFFEQVARGLPEAFIWTQVEIALTKGKPAAYFSKVCKANLK